MIAAMVARLTVRVLATALVATVVVAGSASAATITIINLDRPGEGFTDPTPTAAVGGNTGTTLGEQRLNVFAYAASLWGDRLESTNGGGADIEIEVEANFDPLFCDTFGAVLGSAGPEAVAENFAGASLPNTWYPIALASHLFGGDVDPGGADIGARFNSAIDDGCFIGGVWYYGFDGQAGLDIDLVSTVLHELGHGLGFLSLVDLGTGIKLSGDDDVYMLNLEDHSTGEQYPDMSNAERVTASTDTTDLHWTGPAVVDYVQEQAALVAASLTGGFDPGSSHIEMYAPASQEPGSSVSHFSTAVVTDEIMEPILTGPNHNLELTLRLMDDIGWTSIIGCGDADRSGGPPEAVDALITLSAAVGLVACSEALCDPDASGTIQAIDALIVLSAAVGLDVDLDCGYRG